MITKLERLDIEKKVRNIVIKRFDLKNLKEEDITPESDFCAEFGADSLDLVELKMLLEVGFGISISEEEEEIKTIRDAVDRIIKEKEKMN